MTGFSQTRTAYNLISIDLQLIEILSDTIAYASIEDMRDKWTKPHYSELGSCIAKTILHGKASQQLKVTVYSPVGKMAMAMDQLSSLEGDSHFVEEQ